MSSADALVCVNMNAIGNTMNFYVRKQELLKRAKRFEEKASREGNVQASDRMRALALLYREMAEELEEDGLFEQRLFPLDFAEFACDGADAGVLPASVKIDSAGSFFRAGH